MVHSTYIKQGIFYLIFDFRFQFSPKYRQRHIDVHFMSTEYIIFYTNVENLNVSININVLKILLFYNFILIFFSLILEKEREQINFSDQNSCIAKFLLKFFSYYNYILSTYQGTNQYVHLILKSLEEVYFLNIQGSTLKPRYNEPRYSEFCDIVN